MTTPISTRQETIKRKGITRDRPKRRPSYDDNMRILHKFTNSTARWIEIRTSNLDEAKGHHPTFLYQHLHHVRQPGTRGGSRRGYFRRQYSYGTRTANTLVRWVFFLGRKLQKRLQRRRLPTRPSSKESKTTPISHLECLCGMQ